MNVDELRKSMRKQKLEKQGLTITNILLQSAHSTGTGTGNFLLKYLIKFIFKCNLTNLL